MWASQLRISRRGRAVWKKSVRLARTVSGKHAEVCEIADYRLRLSAGMIVVLIPRGAALPRGDA
jgi:hypothetical protein